MTPDIVTTLIEQPKPPPPLLTSRQIDEGSPVMSTPQYGDYQFDIDFDRPEGQFPKYPSPDYLGFEVVRRLCSFRSSSTPAGPWTSSGSCTRGSPKISARPGCAPTTFSSTSSKWQKRTGRSGEVS